MTESSIKLGHRIVTSILAFLLITSLASFVLSLVTDSINALDVLRLGFTVWLCWLVYQGRLWARLFLIVWIFIGSAGSLLTAVSLGLATPFGFLFFIIGVGFLASSVLLFAARPVRHYFAYVSDEVLI